MAHKLEDEEAQWLRDPCLPEHAVSEPPGWAPGKFFMNICGGKMRYSGQLETAYLMLERGKHLCFKVQEPETLSTRYSKTVYHGTSLGAIEKIMTEGWRPSLGAGSDEVGKKYGGEPLPMVYTSGLLETAHGYVGNVADGQRNFAMSGAPPERGPPSSRGTAVRRGAGTLVETAAEDSS